MIPDRANGPIKRLAFVTEETEAENLIVEAVQRGADIEEAAEALRLWRQVQAYRARRAGGAS